MQPTDAWCEMTTIIKCNEISAYCAASDMQLQHVARTLLCTCGCVLHWYSNRQGRWLMVDVLVTGLKSDWSGSGKQRLVPVQNQYQDRYIL